MSDNREFDISNVTGKLEDISVSEATALKTDSTGHMGKFMKSLIDSNKEKDLSSLHDYNSDVSVSEATALKTDSTGRMGKFMESLIDANKEKEQFSSSELPNLKDGPILDPHVEGIPDGATPLPGGGYRVPIPGYGEGWDVPGITDVPSSDVKTKPVVGRSDFIDNFAAPKRVAYDSLNQNPPSSGDDKGKLVVESWEYDDDNNVIFKGTYENGEKGESTLGKGELKDLIFDSEHLDKNADTRVYTLFSKHGSIENCDFYGIDLNLTEFPKEISHGNFHDCDMSYADLSSANVFSSTFVGCDMNHANFENSEFLACGFKDCAMAKVDDKDAFFSSCVVDNCNLDEPIKSGRHSGDNTLVTFDISNTGVFNATSLKHAFELSSSRLEQNSGVSDDSFIKLEPEQLSIDFDKDKFERNDPTISSGLPGDFDDGTGFPSFDDLRNRAQKVADDSLRVNDTSNDRLKFGKRDIGLIDNKLPDLPSFDDFENMFNDKPGDDSPDF